MKGVPHRLLLGQGHIGQAALSGETVFVPDLTQAPGADAQFTLREGMVAEKANPLLAKGRLIGVLAVFTRRHWDLSPEEEEFLEALLGQGAVALANALTFQELLKSQRELEAANDLTLWGWAKAVELRDQETAGPTARVTELTLRLARALGVPEEDLEHIRRGAILHDVGEGEHGKELVAHAQDGEEENPAQARKEGPGEPFRGVKTIALGKSLQKP